MNEMLHPPETPMSERIWKSFTKLNEKGRRNSTLGRSVDDRFVATYVNVRSRQSHRWEVTMLLSVNEAGQALYLPALIGGAGGEQPAAYCLSDNDTVLYYSPERHAWEECNAAASDDMANGVDWVLEVAEKCPDPSKRYNFYVETPARLPIS